MVGQRPKSGKYPAFPDSPDLIAIVRLILGWRALPGIGNVAFSTRCHESRTPNDLQHGDHFVVIFKFTRHDGKPILIWRRPTSGYVRGGIWQVTRELGQINQELGVDLVLSCSVLEVDTRTGLVRYEISSGTRTLHSDHLVMATDPQTAARLTGDSVLLQHTSEERVSGTAGTLNLMFRNPVQWKQGSEDAESDSAFRYYFAVDTVADFEAATLAVLDGAEFVPGYFQVYCEGAGMRSLGLDEPYDRLTVFFKNLALGKTGEQLAKIEAQVKQIILSHIANPEDCAWSRLLTPRDLQQTFGFPGGNIEHTMLVEGQSYSDRQYGDNAMILKCPGQVPSVLDDETVSRLTRR